LNASVDVLCEEDESYNLAVNIDVSGAVSILSPEIDPDFGAFIFSFGTEGLGGEPIAYELVDSDGNIVFETPHGHDIFSEYSEYINNLDLDEDYTLILYQGNNGSWSDPVTITNSVTGDIIVETDVPNFIGNNGFEIELGNPPNQYLPITENILQGVHIIGPYTDTTYTLIIQSEVDPNCFQIIDGFGNCSRSKRFFSCK